MADVNYESLQYDKGFQFGSNDINQDDVIDFKPTDMRARVGIGANCGKVTFMSNFKAGVEESIKTLFSDEFIKGVAQAAPLMAICTYDKATCAAIQNLNQMASFMAQFKLRQCAIIDKYTSGQANEYKKSYADCIGKEQKRGREFEEAKKACLKTVTEKIASITGDNPYVKKVNIVKDTLNWLGVKDEEVLKDAKEMVGETTVGLGVITLNFDTKDGRALNLVNEENRVSRELSQSLCVKEKVHSLNNIINTSENMKEVVYSSYPEYVITKLSKIPRYQSIALCKEVMLTATRAKIYKKVTRLHSLLAMGLGNPKLTTTNKELLQQKVNYLETYIGIRNQDMSRPIERVTVKIIGSEEEVRKAKLKDDIKFSKRIYDKKDSKNDIESDCIFSVEC